MRNKIKIINFKKKIDNRGYLIKIFNNKIKLNNKTNFPIKEHVISFSKKNVIRGMHYQSGKHSQNKIIYVIEGKILDVVIDLRKNSNNFSKVFDFVLSSKNNKGVYVPKNFAHGFKVLSDYAIVGYLLDNFYNKKNDKGIFWQSINYNWKTSKPIVSKRDKNFPTIENY